MNCLLLHVPKFSSVYLPLGEFMNVTYMPMGLPALAQRLNQAGHKTDMIHLGVEWIVDSQRPVVSEIAAADYNMIGMPLYWHYQTYDVLDVAERIKEKRPELFLFLGGVTAGFFAKEILENYRFVDAIIIGDGEIAVVELAEAIAGKREFSDVANLVWRDVKGGIVSNGRRIASDQAMIDSLIFGDLSNLRNASTYVESFGFPLAYPKQFSKQQNQQTQKMGKRSFFPLFTGRGCAWKCSFCAGNRETLRNLTATPTLRFRDCRRVVDDVELAMANGYQTMALCFDPVPHKDDYYVSLFQEIRRRRLKVDFYFECWGLPTERFLKEWVATFGADNEHSYLALSPDAGNEEVRFKNKQPYYSNAEFFATLDKLEEYKVSTDVFFTIALPFETIVSGREVNQLTQRIRDSYTITKRIMTWSVQLEPGSPQYLDPEKYAMETDRRSVIDYYNAHGGGSDTYSALGFKIRNYFGDERDNGTIQDFEDRIQLLKCMEFCFLGDDPTRPSKPAEGRKWCAGRRNQIAESAGLPKQQEISPAFQYRQAAERLAKAFPPQRPRYA